MVASAWIVLNDGALAHRRFGVLKPEYCQLGAVQRSFFAEEGAGGVHRSTVINTQFVFHLRYNSARNKNTATYIAPFGGKKCQLPCRKWHVLKNVSHHPIFIWPSEKPQELGIISSLLISKQNNAHRFLITSPYHTASGWTMAFSPLSVWPQSLCFFH